MVILLSKTQASLRLCDPRKPKTEAAFVQRKENKSRGAGTPHTLQEARKDCKTQRAEDSL
jgi:hypothetical protein